MSTPVAKLPKDLLIGEGLKDEILKEHNLKPTEATEKNVLPSAEDVKQEKTHQNILSGKENNILDSLRNRNTLFDWQRNRLNETKGELPPLATILCVQLKAHVCRDRTHIT